MAEFLRSVGNIIVLAVTFLGFFALFIGKLELRLGLFILFVLLFAMFIILITHQVNRLEKKIGEMEENYKRQADYIKLSSEIEALKIVLSRGNRK
jgi:Ca2+/Na+ antiporter